MTYELQRLVTLATFGTPWEAQITQARLAAENIPSWIADEHLMRLVALSNAVGGVQLKVRESDAEAAGQMLRRLGPLPELRLVPEPLEALAPMAPMAPVEELPVARTEGEAALRCPSCGSEDLQAERSSRLLTALLPRSRAALRCGDCGVLWRQDELSGTERGAAAGQDDDEAFARLPLLTVARFHTPWEAHLASTLLESEGIRCCVLEERMPAVSLLSAEPPAFNRVAVQQADAARATAILSRAWSYPSPDAGADPAAGD